MSEPNANAIPSTRAANRSRTHKLTISAMLSGVAFLLMFIEFPIPALIPSFVKLDVSDLPELLAAFSLGPVYGIVVTFLKNLLFSVLHGTSSAYVGELFNFVMGYGLPLDAIIGMYQAILPSSDSLIKCLTIFNMPFTFFKGMLDVVLCFLIYKPLSPLLHK